MSEIQIVVPDSALRQALAEGLLLAKAGEIGESADLAAALEDAGAIAVILDETAADKKALGAFETDSIKLRQIFLLGEAGASWREHPAVEVFPKPLRLGHLLTRLTFHLRTRSRGAGKKMLGPWGLEVHNRQITRETDGLVIRLTEKETALLDYLAQSETPVEREELLAAVWGHDGRIDTHTLETHVYQLRRKLDPEGHGVDLLVNERGAYRLKADG